MPSATFSTLVDLPRKQGPLGLESPELEEILAKSKGGRGRSDTVLFAGTFFFGGGGEMQAIS